MQPGLLTYEVFRQLTPYKDEQGEWQPAVFKVCEMQVLDERHAMMKAKLFGVAAPLLRRKNGLQR